MTLRVRFGDDGEELAGARPGEREGESEDALHAGASHDRDVGRDLYRETAMDAPADARIFAFRVFAYDHPVEFRTVHAPQRAGYPWQNTSRANVGVLVERLADRESEAPQADVIGHVRRADRAEIDRVMVLDLLATIRRHHEPGLAISVGAPIELIEVPFHPALALGDRLQDFEASRNDLLPDAVAGNDRDPIASHEDDPLLTSPFGKVGKA